MLEIFVIHNKSRKTPTASGLNLGLATEEKLGQYGTYLSVTYNKLDGKKCLLLTNFVSKFALVLIISNTYKSNTEEILKS